MDQRLDRRLEINIRGDDEHQCFGLLSSPVPRISSVKSAMLGRAPAWASHRLPALRFLCFSMQARDSGVLTSRPSTSDDPPPAEADCPAGAEPASSLAEGGEEAHGRDCCEVVPGLSLPKGAEESGPATEASCPDLAGSRATSSMEDGSNGWWPGSWLPPPSTFVAPQMPNSTGVPWSSFLQGWEAVLSLDLGSLLWPSFCRPVGGVATLFLSHSHMLLLETNRLLVVAALGMCHRRLLWSRMLKWRRGSGIRWC